MEQMYEEFEGIVDLDEAIAERKRLIEEAKGIEESSDSREVIKKINELKRKWRKLPYWESAYEDELAEEFDGYLNVFYEKRNAAYKENEEKKKDLILRAKKEENMSALMEEWKSVGSAGRENDETLWQEFNKLRQDFYERRHQAWENQKERFANAKVVKEALIEEAKTLVDGENIIETNEAFNKLFERWKEAGRAEREVNDQLWEQFNEVRQKFYDRRNTFFKELHARQNDAFEAKKKLLEEANELLSKNNFSREVTERMKALSVEWKAAGTSGKERDDRIWKQFREVMDQYFDGLKKWNEGRQARFMDRLQETKERKNAMIQNQKRYIERMEREKAETLSESMIRDLEEAIEDKKAFIAELEAEIAELDAKINA